MLFGPGAVDCRNNLFLNSYFSLTYQANNGTPGVWELKDNLFDQTANGATTDAQGAIKLDRSRNGFTAGTVNNLGGMDNKTGLDRDFVPGPLGEYYYPVNDLPSSLARLRDAGSRSALEAGLACATTRTDHAPDEGTVDIGFHYRLPGGPPTVTGPLEFSTCRDQDVAMDLTPFAGSPNRCPLGWILVSGPEHGQLLGALPLVTYRPDPNYQGWDTFRWAVSDGGQQSEIVLVRINVGEVPTAAGQAVMVGKNSSVDFCLFGWDGCGDPLTYRVTRGPDHGAVSLGNGSDGTYSPASDYEGLDSFDFVTNDGVQDSLRATVTIYVVPGPVLAAECRYGWIRLTWDMSAIEQTFGGIAHGFKVYRADTEGGPYTLLTQTPLSAETRLFADTSVSLGLTYYYVVTFTHDEPDQCNPGATVTYESPFSNEVPVSTCTAPPPVPTDLAFIVDNTSSQTSGTIEVLKAGIAAVLNDLVVVSGGNYRLALVTPDDDQVNVRLPFPQDNQPNRATFENALKAVTVASGNDFPESTDECLNTVVNGLLAANRVNPRPCPPKSPPPLQIGDFQPAFSYARRLVVLITDAPPGGFCDTEDFGNPTQAHLYALNARAQCVRINAIYVDRGMSAEGVMLDYAQTSCGWYSVLPSNGSGIVEALTKMFYEPGYAGSCNCP